MFPYLNQQDHQQIEVSDHEIDQCTVKPVRIQTIVSALMMARRRSFRNPKKVFDPLIKFQDPRTRDKPLHSESSNYPSETKNDELGDQSVHTLSPEVSQLANLQLGNKENKIAAPSGELNLKPLASQENNFKLRNIFTRLHYSSSDSSSDYELK